MSIDGFYALGVGLGIVTHITDVDPNEKAFRFYALGVGLGIVTVRPVRVRQRSLRRFYALGVGLGIVTDAFGGWL